MSHTDAAANDRGSRVGLPRDARLLTKAHYGSVFAGGCRVSDRFWTVVARAHAGSGGRLGLAIAKKRVRRAVDRNRLKRLVRESFRHRRAELFGHDVVVMARDNANSAPSAVLTASLDKLWKQTVRQCRRS